MDRLPPHEGQVNISGSLLFTK